MFIFSVVLTCVGAALSVFGVYWGAFDTVRKYKSLEQDLGQIEAINQDTRLSLEEKDSRRHAVRYPSGNWGKLEYFEENAQLAALSLLINNLKWPALLTVLGVLVSAAASVVSLWV
ncbi:hypothetical protein ACFWAT_09110 [Streptomyces syringium]|uniref:hypothetical protein n=1 Tax=Streptomyces syringium TaxID=76729 RepID=UPI00364A41C2